MLSKKKRLRRTEFNRFFLSGKRFHSPIAQLIYQPYEEFKGSVVVGKKIYKTAVARNRLRRQVYGILYRWQKTEAMKGVYIIIMKPSVKGLSAKLVQTEILKLLQTTVKPVKI